VLQAAFYSAAVQRTAKEQKMPAHRAVLESENSSKADNARKNTAFPPVCKKCAKVCRAPEKGKSHEESYDSSWDFGALEGTRIPGPLIKRKGQLGFGRAWSFVFMQNYRAFCAWWCMLNRVLFWWIRHK